MTNRTSGSHNFGRGQTATDRANMQYGRNGRVMNGSGAAAHQRYSDGAYRADGYGIGAQRTRNDYYSRQEEAQIRRQIYHENLKKYEKRMKKMAKRAKKAEKKKKKEAARLAEEAFRRNEIRVDRQRIPFRFILSTAIAFVLLLAMVLSFAQLAEAKSQLADIESQISVQESLADKLRLKLEEKNDLGVIEKLATEEYNMIKEGSVQKRYISISAGDRVVLVGEEAPENSGFISGMLSSVSAVFDDLLDYIK